MTDDLFTVTRFDRQGRPVDTLSGLPRDTCDRSHMGGGTYVHLDDTELVFKPYRQTDPYRTERQDYLSPGRPRLSNSQILAAAKRFEADGEMDNAVNMLGLLK